MKCVNFSADVQRPNVTCIHLDFQFQHSHTYVVNHIHKQIQRDGEKARSERGGEKDSTLIEPTKKLFVMAMLIRNESAI